MEFNSVKYWIRKIFTAQDHYELIFKADKAVSLDKMSKTFGIL